MSLVLRCWIW